MRIKMAQFVQPLPVSGYSNRASNQVSVITLDEEHNRLEIVSRAKKNGKAERALVPMSAVLFIEPMSEDELLEEMQREEAAKAKAAAPPRQAPERGRKAAMAVDDTRVYRKGKDGKVIEVSRAEAAKLDAEDA